MKSFLILSLLCAVFAGRCEDIVLMKDDFGKKGDLGQWTPKHAHLVGETIHVDGGKLRLSGPYGDDHRNVWESILMSEKRFDRKGAYRLDFEIQTDIQDVLYQGFVRVTLPGGLEMRWWDWDNPGRLFYQDKELAVIPNGASGRAVRFTLVQNGTEVEAHKDGKSIFHDSVSEPPDFETYGRVVLFTKFKVASPTVLDNLALTFTPAP